MKTQRDNNILSGVVDKKKEKIVDAKYRLPIAQIKRMLADIEPPRDFRRSIRRDQGPIRLIAEIKKASPSKGLIRDNFDLLQIARIYEENRVDAISVLTEEDYFQGHLSYLEIVHRSATKPLLRKDFIIDDYQIYESRLSGADAVLLIGAILDINQASEYCAMATELGMTVLFEVHNSKELEEALLIGADVIGINNRNLKTLDIDLSTTLRLKNTIPADKIVVSESGIRTRKDVLILESYGVDAMLIGTAFMESTDIAVKIEELVADNKTSC
ncbi:MAG TPA: indole-3-glycerol phosphate synthase TrpC [Dissulfurispiraceae bacterium]|nr:indole-3-glycerol phosphate synthase TrpC [Dissulfurispiraceae bacterium]